MDILGMLRPRETPSRRLLRILNAIAFGYWIDLAHNSPCRVAPIEFVSNWLTSGLLEEFTQRLHRGQGGSAKAEIRQWVRVQVKKSRAGGPSMQVSSISRAALAALLSGALACSVDRIQSPSGPALSPGPASFGAVDQNSSATYVWIIGGDVAQSSNGDQITLSGTGPLGIHPKSATGGGNFNSDVIGSGTWIVTELLSFQAYGPGTLSGLPPGSTSGRGLFRVQLMPTGKPSVEGILDLECNIPGSTVPGGIHEGI